MRRRLLGGLLIGGLATLTAGCERPLSGVPTPLTSSLPLKRQEPPRLDPAEPPETPGLLVGAVFGRTVRLEGITLERESVGTGEFLRVWLHWQSVASAQEDLRSMGRLVTGSGRVLASEDDQIGRRRRFLTRWEVGERSVDEMRVRITPSTQPGEYGFVVGVLRADNQTSVPVTSRPASGSLWQEDAVLIATVEVLAG